MNWLKRKIFSWVAPGLYGENQELNKLLAESMTETDALRSSLVLKHQQALGAMTTLFDMVGGLMLSQGTEEVILSGDLLASANALGMVEVEEHDDGSMTIRLPKGQPPEMCDHCDCGEDDCGLE